MTRIWCWAALFLFLSKIGAVFATPTDDIKMLAARPHPRTLDVQELQANRALLDTLQKTKPVDIAHPSIVEPGATLPADKGERSQHFREIQSAAFREEEGVLHLALSALVLQDETLATAARQRALHLAGWSPKGATGFFFHDQAGRTVAWTLALAFDWMNKHWSVEEKRILLAAIKPRVEDMLSPPVKGQPSGWAGLDWGRQLDSWPYDSHGAVTLARLTVICTVLAGEDELFDRCAKEIVPRYLAQPIPWGGSEGGYANGTSYAQWDVLFTHFVVWHLLKNALSVDLWKTEWARGYLNFMTYFLPPGAPSGLFGDGAEQRHAGVWATQAKAYAAARPAPLAGWYARNQFGEDVASLPLLLAGHRDWSLLPGQFPPDIPHAVQLADIGWVAMHSDLGDRARTSVYFKSSPYGSYNHSHADQNSFVIHASGRALAIDSGYYDFYGSPHWKAWYKQTRAHNAITFDGGQGQLHDSMAAKGKITRFEHSLDFDVATGDALAAYGDALSRAMRSLVYVRPDALLVYDALASDTPRTWEWNIHALSRIKDKGVRSIEIEQEGVRLCIELLEAPEGAFSQDNRFTAEPSGKYPPQWHARFTSRTKSAKANFLALLDVDCRRPEVSLRRETGRRVVTLAGRRFVFDEYGEVRGKP